MPNYDYWPPDGWPQVRCEHILPPVGIETMSLEFSTPGVRQPFNAGSSADLYLNEREVTIRRKNKTNKNGDTSL